ncbi:MAG: serine/threonine-protein phosphatase [Chloroflexi bacterium]|nr:serine/threonine-protein phosphatase [Chloroflexota bacterium]
MTTNQSEWKANGELLPRRPHLSVGWMSDVGRLRENNEDALLVLTSDLERGEETQSIGLLAVADGMGGYEHGERASEMAVRVAAEVMLRSFVAKALLGSSGGESLIELMRGAVSEAHHQVQQNLPGAGTTLTLVLVADESIAVAHVGDSRAYLCRDGAVRQLTRDHSLVARLVETGQQTLEEASTDPRLNVLYRALGQADELDVDFQFGEFPAGSRLLLCSDGLWGHVDADVLEKVLCAAGDPNAGCAQLVDLANQAGGPDNITAILAIRE